jgi:hypothetical protein
MSSDSDSTWKRDAKSVDHPTPETLLAYIREQCSEHEKSSIDEHLLAGCAACNRLHAGLSQSSNALNQLEHMSRYLYYPELQSNQVLRHAQRGEPLTSAWTGKRKRKFQARSRPASRPQVTGRYARKAGLRYMSIPAAFGIFLIVAVIAIALAYAFVTISGRPSSNVQPGNRFYNPGPNTTGLVQQQPTPTNTVPVAITPTVSGTGATSPTPTTTIIKGAGLDACPPAQYVGPAIFICGYGFKAGDKVWLEVDYYGSNSLKTLGPFLVHNDGEFKVSWIISCKNSPVTVYAADKMQQPLTVPLTNISRDGCYWPTLTATPGSHQ